MSEFSLEHIQWGPALEGFGLGMDFFGKLNQADQTKEWGSAAERASANTAAQLRINAGQAEAASQYKMLELRRQGDLAQSRSIALLAASGASATDPTVITMLARLKGVEDQNVGMAKYQGQSEAQALRGKAKMVEYEGQLQKWSADNQADAMKTSAWGGLVKGVFGMFDKYGKGKPSGDSGSKANVDYNQSADTPIIGSNYA